MPKGVQGFQKCHPVYGGITTRFTKGLLPHNKGIRQPKTTGSGNGVWKGEEAKYAAKHMWIRYHYGKASRCENPNCHYPRVNSIGKILTSPKAFNWANVSGFYKREIGDWLQLCASCHGRWDRGLIEINGILK